eukprot:jgi/Botrbrau1/18527/Bobra.0412s0002.2
MAESDYDIGNITPAGQIAVLKERCDGLENVLSCKQEVINFHNWQIDILKTEAANLRSIIKHQEAYRLYMVAASAQEGFAQPLGSVPATSGPAEQIYQETLPTQPAQAAVQQSPYTSTMSGNTAKRKRSPADDVSSH